MEQKVQTKCQDSQKREQKDGITKGWERSTTYETRCSWTAQDAKLVKQGRFQAEIKDHHKSSTLYQVSGHYLKSFPWSCYSHKRRNNKRRRRSKRSVEIHKRKDKRMAWQEDEKGVQHMRQDAHEQLKMQGRKGPPKVSYPSSHDVIMLQWWR